MQITVDVHPHPSHHGKHFLLPKNMTTREMQYLRLKTEEPILGWDPLAVSCAQGNCSFKNP
jgi:hypothetical protein